MEAVSISPDGSTLASGGRDGQLVFMSLNVPTVIPRPETGKTTTSATVRHSREILEQSRMRSTSDPDPLNTPSEGSTTELASENFRMVNVPEAASEKMAKDGKRRSRHIAERRPPDIAAVVALRRNHDKRLKDKVVDIPTMIAHLSARASMIIEDPSSSSSSSESDDESADSEDNESQFLVNVSERANQFMKQEKTVIGTASEIVLPPPQRLSLLPNEAVGRLKENRNVFQKRETEKERKPSKLFEDNTMDSVVLLMKNFLDENKPAVTAASVESDKVERGYLHHAGVGEAEDSDSSLDSNSASINSAPDSHHHASGHYSLSPEHPNSEERTTSEGRQSSTSTADDKRQSLKRGSSASGNEYGDEVPLSVI